MLGQTAHYRNTILYFFRKVRHYPSSTRNVYNITYNSIALTQQSSSYVLNSIAVQPDLGSVKHRFVGYTLQYM